MDIFRITIPQEPTTVKPIYLVPISDTHFGAVHHDRDLWQRVKRFILSNDNCYCCCLGDLGEFIPHKDKRFTGDHLCDRLKSRAGDLITAEIELIVDELYPIKDKILFMLTGNHDNLYKQKIGIDIIKLIANELGINQKRFPYEALVKLFFGNKSRYSVTIYASHGWGGGMLKGAKINRAQHIVKNFDADIYIAGHSHDMVVAPEKTVKVNSKGTAIYEQIRWLIRIAGFRKSRIDISGYEEYSGMPPNVTGTVVVEFLRHNSTTTKLLTNVRFFV